MEAARVAKLRGHEVTLFEKKALGGLLHEASAPEFKADIRPLMKYQISLKSKNWAFQLSQKEATPEDLKDFDAVIVATGSRPMMPKVPGMDGKNVCDALDVLNEEVQPTGRIAIIVVA